MSQNFGHTQLGRPQQRALRRAKRLQVISIAYLVTAVGVVAAVMGSSQAMKAAWVEDCLGFLPPISFLVAVRQVSRKPDRDHPYGYHRAVGAAHLVASVALLVLGSYMVVDSGMTLLKQEHPTIGTIELFGHTIWLGWVMMAALVYTGLPNVVLGRMKLGLAEQLHDKVLYADADMNKADWSTAAGAIAGVLGIGLGLWWADSVVAIFIAGSIVKDGWSNIGHAIAGLLDRQARTYDDTEDHPAIEQVRTYVDSLPWVEQTQVRMRDQGHVFHTEVFVVPNRPVDVRMLDEATRHAREMDWKLDDLQLVPVRELPTEQPE